MSQIGSTQAGQAAGPEIPQEKTASKSGTLLHCQQQRSSFPYSRLDEEVSAWCGWRAQGGFQSCRVSKCEWLITVEVACVSNPVPLLDSAKTRLCVPQHGLIKPIMWQATSSNDDDFQALCPFGSILDHLLTPAASGASSRIKMMCNPTGWGWESRVSKGLRQGYATGLADSCDNYRLVYYNLMLNIKIDRVGCSDKTLQGYFTINSVVCHIHMRHMRWATLGGWGRVWSYYIWKIERILSPSLCPTVELVEQVACPSKCSLLFCHPLLCFFSTQTSSWDLFV